MKVGDLVIDVVKKDIKHFHLRVYPPDGMVRITSPRRLDDATIRQYVVSKISWIEKSRAKLRALPRQLPREYISGESIDYKGDRYLLEVIYHSASPKVVIRDRTLEL